MSKPKVTVVITVKNSKDTIKACVESVLKNKYPKQVIVIDAFSSDGTYEILKQIKGIKLLQLKSNAAEAFNHGIKMAKTPIVALTDADCVVEKDWLKNLVEKIKGDYVAAAGYCTTPKGMKGLSKAIGYSFDERYDIDADEVLRAPTMNLAFKTDIGKKVLFDESLPIAFETDFCFNLLKFGKMKYVKGAVVYHHHRATWGGFWKQQKNYGKYGMLVYLRHPRRVSGDHISLRRFFFEVGLFYLMVATFILGLFFSEFLLLSVTSFAGILIMFGYETLKLMPENPFTFILMQAVRLVAWCWGGVEGFIHFLGSKLPRCGKSST